MASVQRITGKYENALSQPNQKWVLTAEENNLFEVPEWIPQTIDNPKKITWTLKDNKKQTVFQTVSGTVLEKLVLAVSKKYSGSYGYYVEAALDGTAETAGTFILGHCEAKVTVARLSGSGGTALRYGDPANIHLETEGLNGNQLIIEVYAKKNNQLVGSYNQECINGDVDFTIDDTFVWKAFVCAEQKKEQSQSQTSSKPQEQTASQAQTEHSSQTQAPPQTQPQSKDCAAQPEVFYIKAKNKAAGAYVKDGSGKEEVINLTLQGEILPKPEKPANQTPVKVGKPDKNPVVTGIIDLQKIAVKTTYDVCNDWVNNFSDDENFWILENGGKYYHWLKNNLIDPKDIHKPNPLPITLSSKKQFEFTATFKTILSIDGVKIRVRDRANKYRFLTQPHRKTSGGTYFDVKFISDNTPYQNTAQYFPDFELIFDYSFDEKSWTPLGSAFFCFYITWEEPLFGSFDTLSTETMQIKYNGKGNICETLLWIGCSQTKQLNVVSNEEQIVDKIFEKFKTLKIIRRREGTPHVNHDWSNEGLGYWRNASSASGSFTRGLRSLLKDGEARCGEWTIFFQHILLTQGLAVGADTIGICTEYAFSKTPYFPNYTEKTTIYKSNPSSFQFAVKNAIHTDASDPDKTSGDSAGQGNPKTQPVFMDHFWFYYLRTGRFFDASYGISYNSANSNLKQYCKDNVNSVFLIDFTANTGSIVTTDLHNHVRATKNLF